MQELWPLLMLRLHLWPLNCHLHPRSLAQALQKTCEEALLIGPGGLGCTGGGKPHGTDSLVELECKGSIGS